MATRSSTSAAAGYEFDEVVPYDHVSPSPDGYFWRCHTVKSKNYDVHGHADYVDGERRCFFAPPQSL